MTLTEDQRGRLRAALASSCRPSGGPLRPTGEAAAGGAGARRGQPSVPVVDALHPRTLALVHPDHRKIAPLASTPGTRVVLRSVAAGRGVTGFAPPNAPRAECDGRAPPALVLGA